jgi:ribosomal protein S18 acetylase RimI-like enzyme
VPLSQIRGAAAADLDRVDTLWKESAAAQRVDAVADRAEIAGYIARNLIDVGESGGNIVAARATHFYDKPVGWQMNVEIFTADPEAERNMLQDSIHQAGGNADVKLVHYKRGRGEPVELTDLGFNRGPAYMRMDRPNLNKVEGGVLPKGFTLTSYAEGRFSDTDWRQTYDDAFANESGFIPLSQRTWESFFVAPGFDPNLFLMAVATDSGKPAAIVLCRIKRYQDNRLQPVGLVEVVGTRPSYRGRHVATEVTTIALRRLAYRKAGSGSVRAETTNSSVGIYHRLGFADAYIEDVWEYR